MSAEGKATAMKLLLHVIVDWMHTIIATVGSPLSVG